MTLTADTKILTLVPFGGGRYDAAKLPEMLRMTYWAGDKGPPLGLVLLSATRFTPSSHTYTANMKPFETADAPTPAYTFQGRSAPLVNRLWDGEPVLALEWQAGDFTTPGLYRLQFKAVTTGDATRIEYLPEIEIEVLERS